jgi:trk system potassium uptake protein TrkH
LKPFFDNILLFSKKPVDLLHRLILLAVMILGIVGGLVLIYDLAFFNFQYFLKEEHLFFRVYSHLLFLLFSTSVLIKIFILKKLKIDRFDIFFTLFFGILVIFYYAGIEQSGPAFWSKLKVIITFLTIILLFIFEFSKSVSSLERLRLNPSLLFTISFVLIILSGAFLLMAPNSTYKGINFVNALFTSTSAVCVTGLTVLDTAKDFTRFGQVVILMLIQVGGLGIMTFTGLLGYILSGIPHFRTN